jgi:hypothetical protein
LGGFWAKSIANKKNRAICGLVAGSSGECRIRFFCARDELLANRVPSPTLEVNMVFAGWLNRIDAIGVGMVVAILLAIISTSAALAKDDTLFTSDFAGA